MGSAIAPDKKPLPICSSTLKCSITAGVVIPRWAPDLRFSSCKTGSSLATKPDRRHKSYRLEGEKQREPQSAYATCSDQRCSLGPVRRRLLQLSNRGLHAKLNKDP